MNFQIQFLETSFDRPKVAPLQNTLDGVIGSNDVMHKEQRKAGRYKLWAGLKYPVNLKHSFNIHKDNINMWDQHRDGVFHEL